MEDENLDKEWLVTRLKFASKVISRLCEHKYYHLIKRIENKLKIKIKVIDCINFSTYFYSLLVETDNREKMVLKVVDESERLRRILSNNARALSFLNNFDKIPSPKLLDYDEDYILMEYFEGVCYSDIKDKSIKERVMKQMDKVIKEMKSITSEQGSYLDKTRLHSEKGIKSLKEAVSYHPWMRECYLKDGRYFVLNHNDLHGKNVIVNKEKGLVGIIDWEYAGFYPLNYEKSKYIDIGGDYCPFLDLF